MRSAITAATSNARSSTPVSPPRLRCSSVTPLAEEPHDRQRHRLEIQGAARLPGRGIDVIRPDGRDPSRGARIRPRRRDREADRVSVVSTVDAALPVRPRGPSAVARTTAFVGRHVLAVYSLLFFAYLMLPIAVVIAFSFNRPAGRLNYTWKGLTLDNWRDWNAGPVLTGAR